MYYRISNNREGMEMDKWEREMVALITRARRDAEHNAALADYYADKIEKMENALSNFRKRAARRNAAIN